MSKTTYNILHSSDIDKGKWDVAVEKSNSEIYSTSQYLDAVTLGNWRGIVWGNYEKVLPYYQKKKWGLIPYICMPPFSQKYPTNIIEEAELSEIFHRLKTQNQRIDIRVTDKKSYSGTAKTNFIVSKNGRSYDEISSQYSRLLHRNLGKDKILDILPVSSDEAATFLKTNTLFQDLVWKPCSTPFLNLVSKDFIHCIQAIDRQKNLSLGVLVYAIYRNTAYLLFPYQSEAGRNKNAMSFLIDSLVREDTIKDINFEGSSIAAIASFYKQFGAEEEIYWEIRL